MTGTATGHSYGETFTRVTEVMTESGVSGGVAVATIQALTLLAAARAISPEIVALSGDSIGLKWVDGDRTVVLAVAARSAVRLEYDATGQQVGRSEVLPLPWALNMLPTVVGSIARIDLSAMTGYQPV